MRDPEAVTAQAPLLSKPRFVRQSWITVSFLHWAVEPARIAHLYPAGAYPDTFEGRCYVGMVPFHMADTGLPHGPPLFRTFLETNIRLYSVDDTGRRGVVFLSLDTNRRYMVAVGRTVFGVPYRLARMTYRRQGARHTYTSALRWPVASPTSLIAVEVGDELAPGPFEHFLTARWGLHVARFGRTWYIPNDHPPWPLRRAELIDFDDTGVLASLGLGELAAVPPVHVAYSDGVPARFALPVRSTTPRRTLR